MSKRLRTIITVAAALAFFITTPIVILRTLGYRLDLKKGTLGQTGVLIVDSEPEGAVVIVDGRATGDRTPARIRNLTPKQYEVRLEATGYHPWQKTLEVAESGVTFAEDIILFPTREPKLIVSGEIRTAELSPTNEWMAYITNENKLYVRNLLTETNTPIISTLISQHSSIEWSRRGDRFFVRYGSLALVVVLPPGGPRFALTDLLGSPASSIHWSVEEPGSVEAASGTSLVRVDPIARRIVKLATTTGGEARVSGSVLYNVQPTLTAAVLSATPLGGGQPRREITNLTSPTLTIGEPRSPWLPLADRERERILIADTSPDGDEPFEISGTDYAWSPNARERSLLFWNAYELSLADPLTRTTTLLTRLGAGITDAAWNHAGTHVFFSSNGTLTALELNDVGGRNTTTLAEFESVRELLPSPNGKQLFFIGQKNNQPGIYSFVLE